MDTLTDLVKAVTLADCKDDQTRFTTTNRMDLIKQMLADSAYTRLYRGDLCHLYAKQPIEGKPVILISSHTDCVYQRLSFKDTADGLLHGTFDNSLTNACALMNMLQDKLDANVVVAFTGDEEKDSNGAKEALDILYHLGADLSFALVLDVTNEGWQDECCLTIGNDLGIDILTGSKIIGCLDRWGAPYGFVHEAEPDETWDYDEYSVPCMTLSIPVQGNMHSDEGCTTRKAALSVYCQAIEQLADCLSKCLINPKM